MAAVRKRLLADRLAPLLARDGERAWPLVILSNATSLMGTTVVSSTLGVLFWWFAARQFPPAAIGLAAALVSATLLLGTIAVLGFGTLLMTELPRLSHSEQGTLVATGLVFTGGLGFVFGALFWVIGPLFMGDFRDLRGDAAAALWIGLSVGGNPMGLVVDQVLIGRLRSEVQLARNTAIAVLKVVGLELAAFLPLPHDAMTIFATWPLANLLSLGVVAGLPRTRRILTLGRPRLSLLRHLGGAAIEHHALNLSVQLPSLILPVLVTALLSATANAYFYTAWMVAGVSFLPQSALATTLFAIGVREPEVLVSRARLTMLLSLASALGAGLLVAIAGEWILTVFGRQYAEQATLVLRVLTVAGLPLAIKNHFIAFLRIHRRIRVGMIAVAAGAVFELTGAAVGARLGDIPGLSIGWAAALTLEALCMLPSVWRTIGLGNRLPARATVA